MKPRIYVETSVLSYLTSRDSASLVGSSRQLLTRRWWERRADFELFESEVLVRECRDGDTLAAARRMEALDGIPLLSLTQHAAELAALMLSESILPAKAAEDALHIAIAAVHKVDFFLELELQAHCQPGHSSKNCSQIASCRSGTAFYLPTGRTIRRRR